jgi:hypothetical protein
MKSPLDERKSEHMKYLVKRPNEKEEFSFVATLEEIKAGLKSGQIKADWSAKKESGGFFDYWITVDELISGRPLPKPSSASHSQAALSLAASSPPRSKSSSTSPAKRIIKWAAIVFAASCLIPPWQYTADRNGGYGFHSREPAGYSLLFDPPTNPNRTEGHGVQIDFGRLFLEWAAFAAVTGVVWVLVVKPTWLRDDKANPPQKFIPPTGNPEN